MNTPLRVCDVMTTELHCIQADDDIMRAAHHLVSLNISGLLVVAGQQQLIGILTERDCIGVALQAGYFDETGGRVSDFMTTEVVSVDPARSLMDIAERFAEGPHRRYPVLENGQLVGIIARRDVLRALTSGAWFSAPPKKRS